MRVSGKMLGGGLVVFTLVFAGALYYAQTFAFYESTETAGRLLLAGESVPVSDYDGIDAETSPLKLRGCFRTEPAAFEGAPPAEAPEPLVAPFWFDCFDAEAIAADLAAGRATAYRLTEAGERHEGVELLAAIYPDGRGYLWRQLDEDFRE